jgi:hypothetical protein
MSAPAKVQAMEALIEAPTPHQQVSPQSCGTAKPRPQNLHVCSLNITRRASQRRVLRSQRSST